MVLGVKAAKMSGNPNIVSESVYNNIQQCCFEMFAGTSAMIMNQNIFLRFPIIILEFVVCISLCLFVPWGMSVKRTEM